VCVQRSAHTFRLRSLVGVAWMPPLPPVYHPKKQRSFLGDPGLARLRERRLREGKIAQGLKPSHFFGASGTTEVAP
jgi:hypothetical protein